MNEFWYGRGYINIYILEERGAWTKMQKHEFQKGLETYSNIKYLSVWDVFMCMGVCTCMCVRVFTCVGVQ